MTHDSVQHFLMDTSFHKLWLGQIELCLIAFDSQLNFLYSFPDHYSSDIELKSINQIKFVHTIDVMNLVLNLEQEQVLNVVLVQMWEVSLYKHILLLTYPFDHYLFQISISILLVNFDALHADDVEL
ncbi:hypothetical protein Tco_1111773 [Tanacetum coccineum]|uniref:Uncharacterized protein n=1 Tax=Tanacetum coccineum TaxID=301880 RepID=A0ABQ5IP10_9ASTR